MCHSGSDKNGTVSASECTKNHLVTVFGSDSLGEYTALSSSDPYLNLGVGKHGNEEKEWKG